MPRSALWETVHAALRGEPVPPRDVGFGMTIRQGACGPGRWTGDVEPVSGAANSQGVVHGGFLASVLDVAMGHASLTLLGAEEMQRTLEMKINFLAAVPPGPLRAEGEVVRRGKRTAYCEGSVRAGDGTLLARASATFSIR